MSLNDSAATPIHIIATLTAASGQEQPLAQALKVLVAASQAEPGCVEYTLHGDVENPGVFVIYETWANQAELDKHNVAPHFQAFVAAAKTLLSEAPHLRFLHRI